MTTKYQFNLATEKLHNLESEDQYMSDMKNYLMVHVTKYIPKTNKSGEKYIPSTAMAGDYDFPRSTIHVALNHIVKSHGYGDWSEIPYVIMAPMTDVIKQNGNPAYLSGPDTYFSVHPDRGLILPPSAHIVMPGTNIPTGQLFQINGNTTIYKNADFTPDEIKRILENMTQYEIEEYNEYKSGDFKDWQIKQTVSKLGNVGKKLYDDAKDKQAFIRGLFADKCDAMLSTTVRNMAMQQTAKEMGFKTIENVFDGSETLYAISNVADEHNIMSSACNKGHSNSIYGRLEYSANSLELLKEYISENSDSVENFESFLLGAEYLPMRDKLIQALVTDKTVDIMGFFQNVFDDETKKYYADKQWKTMNDWDPNATETMKRYSVKQTHAIKKLIAKIKNLPGYDKFIQRLSVYQQTQMKQSKEY